MNKDRRVVSQVVADLCGAYSTQRSVPSKVLIILRDAVKALADTEERSVKKMEGFKDNETTAQNYRNAVHCLEDLRAAQEALEEGELEEAHPLLLRVAAGPELAVAAPVAKPAPKPTRRGRK